MVRYGLYLVCLTWSLMASATQVGFSLQEQRDLARFVRQECGFCHGLRLTGGLGAPLTAEAMRQRPLDYLEEVILHGIPGTAMPGWSPHLTPQQVRWIAERLREGLPQ